MRFGNVAALAAFLFATTSSSHAIAGPGDNVRRLLTDREIDCSVYDLSPAPAATVVSWSGDCREGLATGRGTAVFFRDDRMAETITADFRDGRVLEGDADIRWSDGAHYAGGAVAGVPDGSGVLTRASGDRFEGRWKKGQLNGQGTAVWANGDRYDGQWRDGKAEGQGVQVWANGDRYDGQWHNDMPNGTGAVSRKDGTQFTAAFVDGKRQPAPQHPAPQHEAAAAPSADAAKPLPAAASAPAFFLDGFAGKSLTALDGSMVALKAVDGGMMRTITAPDGRTDEALFRLVNGGLGAVADPQNPAHITGFFRATDTTLSAEYADGHSEQFALADSGGLSLLIRATSGQTACMAWYPQGHVFSADERKAAVAAYAQRLGLTVAASPSPRAHCQAKPQQAANIAPAVARIVPGGNPRRMPTQTALASTPPYKIGDGPANLQDVPVHDSTVHPIDAPSADAANSDEPIASNCLKVDSDGGYWGFRNHCGYGVQFSYCLLHGTDQITACGDGGNVSGSAPAGGFSSLFADKSLTDGNAEHEFRWVACRGGAGEVVARLDVPDPASGRCLRNKPAQQASN